MRRFVLTKCGFTVIGRDSGFVNARGEEIEELIFELPTIGQDRERGSA